MRESQQQVYRRANMEFESLPTTRDVLVPYYFPDDAQEIPTHDLLDVLFGISAFEQSGCQVWHLRNIFKSLRHHGNAVKVTPNPDMVDSRNFHHMVNAISGIVHRRVSKMGWLYPTSAISLPANWSSSAPVRFGSKAFC